MNIIPIAFFVMAIFQTGHSRKLLISGNDHQKIQTQMNWLTKDSSGVKERDVEIMSVKAGSPLLTQYEVKPSQFVIILIGKDGGEKFRSLKPETTETLFAIIDAMPMRQAELKKKKIQ